MNEKITSLQNPRIKEVVRLLGKPAERRELELIVIEGKREITFAVQAGFRLQSLFWCGEVMDHAELVEFLSETSADESLVTPVSEAVLEKIAYRESSQGIVALAEAKHLSLDTFDPGPEPLLVILESVEKPGNLGAILRTADAAAISGVIICDPRTDIFNPNAIRSSVGCVFTVPLITCTSEEAIDWLRKKKIKTFAASLKAEHTHTRTDFSGSCAIVMGTEADGLSSKWHEAADEWVKIPMRGRIDSLNVSTSCAVLVFEALRQREDKYQPRPD